MNSSYLALKVKPAFDIEEYRLGRWAGLYTVRLHGEPVSELDRFLSLPANKDNEDFNRLVRYLATCPSQGYREGAAPDRARFRDEDSGLLALSVAHPDESRAYPPSLRLFCLRYLDVVVLGAGGVKRSGTLREFRGAEPEADRAVRVMRDVRRRLDSRIASHDIDVLNVCLRGNLSFHSDDLY